MILHVATKTAWQTAVPTKWYRTDSLSSEGFIHCSTISQIVDVANARFRGQKNLLLLRIDETAVGSPIVYEDCYESGQEFPHIYGPLPLRAVKEVIPFEPQADGTFILPVALSGK